MGALPRHQVPSKVAIGYRSNRGLQLPAELADGAENLFVDIEPGKTLLIRLLTAGELVARYAEASRHGESAVHRLETCATWWSQ